MSDYPLDEVIETLTRFLPLLPLPPTLPSCLFIHPSFLPFVPIIRLVQENPRQAWTMRQISPTWDDLLPMSKFSSATNSKGKVRSLSVLSSLFYLSSLFPSTLPFSFSTFSFSSLSQGPREQHSLHAANDSRPLCTSFS